MGYLVLPGPIGARKAKVSVSLVDASMVDQPAVVVAKTEFLVNDGDENRIEFVLEATPRPPKSRWLFDATVTVDENGRLEPGDFVLARSISYEDPKQSEHIVLNLQRVT